MKNKIVCFHNPKEENGYLSNWFMSDFIVSGVTFSSGEQYMMFMKAMTFKDTEVANKILATNDVAKIKKLGRQVRNYNDKQWDSIRQQVMYDGLLEKFRQDEHLKIKLLDTGNAILAECAVKDTIWGIGISMKDSRRFDVSKWKGRNLLGAVLMAVRNTLRIEIHKV